MTLNHATKLFPIIGIVAFSLCSVNALAHLLLDAARHPTPALWLAAALVEVMTAWLVFQAVGTARKLTRSRISKQDRRFYAGVLALFLALAVPSLGLSVAANTREFGSLLLGVQFPLLSVACAVGAAVPGAVAKRERAKERESAEKMVGRKQKKLDRQQAEIERERAEVEKRQTEIKRQALETKLTALGNETETLRQYAENPHATQTEVAEALCLTERTVRNHLNSLESLGLIRRNGRGVEMLVKLKNQSTYRSRK